MEELTTVDEVLDCLGGNTEVGALLGANPKSVSNWRSRGRIPPETFVVMTQALEAAGKTAPSSLWGMVAA